MAMQDLTEGSIRAHLLRMSAFMLLGLLVQTLYSMIDLYWVGRLGSDAVAAVALSSNLMMVVMAISMMLSMGTGVLVSQAFGRSDLQATRQLFNQAVLAACLLSLAFISVFLMFRNDYIDALSGNAETARLSRQFMIFFTPALAIQFPLMSLYSALRGTGDIRTSAISQLATVVLNIVMAPFLIFGWGTGHPLGVEGASLSTFIALILGSSGLLARVFRKGGYFETGPGAWRPDYSKWLAIIRIGSPSAADLGLMAIYASLVMAILQRFGAIPQAAFGIGLRIQQVGMMAPMGVGVALTAVIGQNYGALRGERIRDAMVLALKINTAVVCLFAAVFMLMPQVLVRPFTSDPAVLAAAVDYLRFAAWALLAIGPVFACWGIFGGLGNTLPSLMGSILRTSMVLIPAWALSHSAAFQPRWIWMLNLLASGAQLTLNLWLVRREYGRKVTPLLPPDLTFANAETSKA